MAALLIWWVSDVQLIITHTIHVYKCSHRRTMHRIMDRANDKETGEAIIRPYNRGRLWMHTCTTLACLVCCTCVGWTTPPLFPKGPCQRTGAWEVPSWCPRVPQRRCWPQWLPAFQLRCEDRVPWTWRDKDARVMHGGGLGNTVEHLNADTLRAMLKCPDCQGVLFSWVWTFQRKFVGT